MASREKARGSEEEGKAFRKLHAEEKGLKSRRRGCWPARRPSGGLYISEGVSKYKRGVRVMVEGDGAVY